MRVLHIQMYIQWRYLHKYTMQPTEQCSFHRRALIKKKKKSLLVSITAGGYTEQLWDINVDNINYILWLATF